ncbi:hypothetical protein LCGC14_0629820 [marine sediment metagenome]|uniref:Uncharacterized protein n=1 Tax=marine sediment metagenome TaxID=412755 RepID=A0A0F9TNP3_9ZZZZ
MQTKTMTIYQELKDAGVPLDNHESDLYVKATPEAIEILERRGIIPTTASDYVGIFRSKMDGHIWFDLPFRYDPYWEVRDHKRQLTSMICIDVEAYDDVDAANINMLMSMSIRDSKTRCPNPYCNGLGQTDTGGTYHGLCGYCMPQPEDINDERHKPTVN